MSHVPHQTTPFRRPSGSWPRESRPDPADVGTAFGLELCLEGEKAKAPSAAGDKSTDPAAPPLCP
jgi:hypothetical protein